MEQKVSWPTVTKVMCSTMCLTFGVIAVGFGLWLSTNKFCIKPDIGSFTEYNCYKCKSNDDTCNESILHPDCTVYQNGGCWCVYGDNIDDDFSIFTPVRFYTCTSRKVWSGGVIFLIIGLILTGLMIAYCVYANPYKQAKAEADEFDRKKEANENGTNGNTAEGNTDTDKTPDA